ncbi:MAG: bifunctional adenosylcobinamide kinase/adenosylcobinamide-phosphate guanylyltransferase [Coriobacteriia bacterium]|nr:bifunctional adenosylcobinamide kinase/adenosylcobinamide-phosphate guanylyltransferase [Coriobacteriia bacterium]
MVLITGGCASGKRTFARTLGYGPHNMADAQLDESSAICHVEDLAQEFDGTVEELAELLCGKELVICREMGCGPVPVRSQDRNQRERVGRLSTLLAVQADCVVRMVCGIPCVLKGSLPDRSVVE